MKFGLRHPCLAKYASTENSMEFASITIGVNCKRNDARDQINVLGRKDLRVIPMQHLALNARRIHVSQPNTSSSGMSIVPVKGLLVAKGSGAPGGSRRDRIHGALGWRPAIAAANAPSVSDRSLSSQGREEI